MEKRCKHLLNEGECSLCNGIPRSTFWDRMRMAPEHPPLEKKRIPGHIKFNQLPSWAFDFEYNNTEDLAQEAAGSLL